MNLNSYLIYDYLKLPIKSASLKSNPLRRTLQSIYFFRPKLTFLENMIVIISHKDFLSHYNELYHGCILCPTNKSIPLEQCKADVILLDENLSFLDIYEDLSRIFRDFHELDQSMNKLIRQEAALNLFGNAILNFLWNPISLYSEDMRLLFYSERKKSRQDQIYFEYELNQYLPDEEIEDLKMDKEYNETINAYEPAVFSAARWGYRILFYNIRIDNIYVARLMLLETDRPLKQSDASLLVYLADFVAYMMDKKKITLNNHPRFLDECIESLIEKKDVNKKHLNIALKELNWQINDRFLCATVIGSNFDKKFRTNTPISIRIENALPHSITLLKNDDIFILINLSRSPFSKDELLQQLVYILREGLMHAGISREFSSLNHLSDYYEQTRIALSIGNKEDPMFWLLRYDRYALQSLLYSAKNKRDIESLIPPGLEKLMEYDRINKRNFTHALKIYLQENMHIANTIKKLYLQRATFLYQLKRIKEISELKLDDPNVRLELLIVFKLLDIQTDT